MDVFLSGFKTLSALVLVYVVLFKVLKIIAVNLGDRYRVINYDFGSKEQSELTREYKFGILYKHKFKAYNKELDGSELFARGILFSIYELFLGFSIIYPIMATIVHPVGLFGYGSRFYSVLFLIIFGVGISTVLYLVMIVIESLIRDVLTYFEDATDKIINMSWAILIPIAVASFTLIYNLYNISALILRIF